MRPELPACPYPGIASFSWNDREVFFTRDSEARRLIRLIVLYRGVLLYASSGIGKSSLINTRILPSALEEGLLPVRLRVQPRLGEEILVEPLPFPSFFGGPGGERTALSVEALLDRLDRLRGEEATERPLLIFDQFEEWVTLFEGARETRDRILDTLAKLLNDPRLPVKILISLREDYLARLQPLFERCPTLSDQYVRLTALNGDKVEQVIRGPFEAHPGVWTPEIAPELARELRRQLEERADSEGVPPAEVQIVCRRLFKAGRQGEDLEAFFATQKGVQGLLERFLEESLVSLEEELRGPAVALLARMLTSAGTRNVISRDDLISRVELEDGLPPPLLARALDQLEEKTRLVRREMRRNVDFYEIVSEFLVGWIRPRAEALRLERVERARRRLAWISAGMAAGLLVLGGLALFAFQAWREAERQKELRTSQLLAEQAEDLGDSQPGRALLLALEAMDHARTGSGPPEPRVAERAAGALRSVLGRCRGLVPGGPGRPVIDALLSRDGRWLAGLGTGGQLYLWPASARGLDREPRVLTGFGDPLRGFDADPLADRVAAVRGDGSVAFWDRGVPPSAPPQILQPSDAAARVAFAGGGRWLLTVGTTEEPRLWDLAAGRPSGAGRTLGCPGGRATRAELAPGGSGGSRLALACDDGTVWIWALGGGPLQRARRLAASSAGVSAFSFDRNGTRLATGDRKGAVCLWDLAAAAAPRCTSLNGASEGVARVTLSPDGRRLAAGGIAGTTIVWEPGGTPFRLPRALLGGTTTTSRRSIAAVAWSPDGSWLLSRGLGGYLLLYHIPTGDARLRLIGGSEIVDASFSPESRWVILALANGRLQQWDLAASPDARPLTWRNHATAPEIDFSADGAWLLTREREGPARLLRSGPDQEEGLEPRSVRAASPSMQAAAASSEGHWLATGGTDGVLRLWEIAESGRFLIEPRIEGRLAEQGFRRVAIGPQGRRLLTLSVDDKAQLWDVRTDGAPLALRRQALDVSTLAVSPDTRWAVIAPARRPPLLWDLESPTILEVPLPVSLNPAGSYLALAPEGRWLLTLDTAGDVPLLWDLERRAERPISLRRHSGRLAAVTFSADAQWLATGDEAGTAHLWDLERLRERGDAGLPAEPEEGERQIDSSVRSLAFSPDGRWLASSSRAGTVTLESRATRKVTRFAGDDRGQAILRFSPSGRWLIAASGVTRAWDLSSARPLGPHVISQALTQVLSVVIDPQDRWLAIASRDGLLRRWTLRPDDLRDLACRWAGRNLTREEWQQYLSGEPYRRTCPDFPEPPAGTQ